MSSSTKLAASFRDPSGFVYQRDGCLYRQVNWGYKEHYDHLRESGLYQALTESGQLVRHVEVDEEAHAPGTAYKVLQPDRIPFLSYPYEWSFSQLKDAALLTLDVQKRALDHGMSLKDCSAYNVQFQNGRPIFIDTLSFEIQPRNQPWVAYRQFCEHFLAPLALMSYTDIRLGQLLQTNIDGIPLDLAASLLPFRTKLSFPLLLHIHLHAKAQKRFASRTEKPAHRKFGRYSLLGLLDSLQSAIRALRWEPGQSPWADYYQHTTYSTTALEHKKQLVGEFLDQVRPSCVWDLGANTGYFSAEATRRGIPTIAFDADPACVEKTYREAVRRKDTHVLPLVLDLRNPSPPRGWQNREQQSFSQRGPADTILALALLHHLAIAGNLPLERLARFFHSLCRRLIIEFVPKDDPQVQRLLAFREDIFPQYHEERFQEVFAESFVILRSEKVRETGRTLYLMHRKDLP